MSKSKKTKIALRPDGLPAIDEYRDLPLKNECQHDCLVLDKHEQIFRFKSPSHNHIVEQGIEAIYPDFNAFADKAELKWVLDQHTKIFGKLPHSKQDALITRLALWKALCSKSHDRTEKPVAVDKETGEPKTGKLAARRYILVTADESDVKTYQELVCLRIVASESTEENGEKSIKEDTLKEAVYRRQTELKTKQDAWRIFQYYRPRLIEKKKLRLV
jgi:hypothetical protein